MRRAWPLLAAAALASGACSSSRETGEWPGVASGRPDVCGIRDPQLWARGELPSQFRFQNERVGGLSGIDYRRRQKDYLFVSDDRGANGGGQIYQATLGLNSEHGVDIRFLDSTRLRQVDGSLFAKGGENGTGTDAEAVRSAGGWIYWANEAKGAQSLAPQIFRMRWADGKSLPLVLPKNLVPNADRTNGPRDNRSFEGLSIGRDGSIWVGLEAPLVEDGATPSLTAGSWTRIERLPFHGTIGKDYLYPLEPIARQIPGRLADNGLSELLALPGPAFLVLERSGSQQPDGGFEYVTRIFCAYPDDAGDADRTQRLHKHLVAELNALGPFDNANFEGMTFGPRLPDGRRSLILVADNDFREERPTIFAVLAFR